VKADADASKSLRPPFWYWLLIPALFFLFQTIAEIHSAQPLAYSEFKQLLHVGKVREATVSDEIIRGTLTNEDLQSVLPKEKAASLKCFPGNGCPFTTVRVAAPALVP
jgi:cell division protease FtsH